MSPLIYVTRDIERALGLPLNTPGYFIIANWSDFANEIAAGRKNVLLVKSERQLDTWELLERPDVQECIRTHGNAVLVFKPTKQIEQACHAHGWNVLNPPATLANNIEEKITQLTFLQNIRGLFQSYRITTVAEVSWHREPIVIQFNHSHTGSGTILIKTEKELKLLKQKFPNREARTTQYIDGPLFTNNNVVTPNDVLIGNISYQITGLPPFTDRPFATIGNDWALPKKLLTPKQMEEYRAIARGVGEELRSHDWKGLFGIDVVMELKTGKLFLLEINARQPASASYESQLQESKKTRKQKSITIFEAHLAALSGEDISDKQLIEIDDGAQVIRRITKQELRITEVKRELANKSFYCIEYQNTRPESDQLRIQSPRGIMADHNVFNEIGQKILSAIS